MASECAEAPHRRVRSRCADPEGHPKRESAEEDLTEPANLPNWLEGLLVRIGVVFLIAGVLLVVAGGLPLGRRWRSVAIPALLQFWGATLFLEGLLIMMTLIELPWLAVAVIALLAAVVVPWAAWRRTRQLRAQIAPP